MLKKAQQQGKTFPFILVLLLWGWGMGVVPLPFPTLFSLGPLPVKAKVPFPQNQIQFKTPVLFSQRKEDLSLHQLSSKMLVLNRASQKLYREVFYQGTFGTAAKSLSQLAMDLSQLERQVQYNISPFYESLFNLMGRFEGKEDEENILPSPIFMFFAKETTSFVSHYFETLNRIILCRFKLGQEVSRAWVKSFALVLPGSFKRLLDFSSFHHSQFGQEMTLKRDESSLNKWNLSFSMSALLKREQAFISEQDPQKLFKTAKYHLIAQLYASFYALEQFSEKPRDPDFPPETVQEMHFLQYIPEGFKKREKESKEELFRKNLLETFPSLKFSKEVENSEDWDLKVSAFEKWLEKGASKGFFFFADSAFAVELFFTLFKEMPANYKRVLQIMQIEESLHWEVALQKKLEMIREPFHAIEKEQLKEELLKLFLQTKSEILYAVVLNQNPGKGAGFSKETITRLENLFQRQKTKVRTRLLRDGFPDKWIQAMENFQGTDFQGKGFQDYASLLFQRAKEVHAVEIQAAEEGDKKDKIPLKKKVLFELLMKMDTNQGKKVKEESSSFLFREKGLFHFIFKSNREKLSDIRKRLFTVLTVYESKWGLRLPKMGEIWTKRRLNRLRANLKNKIQQIYNREDGEEGRYGKYGQNGDKNLDVLPFLLLLGYKMNFFTSSYREPEPLTFSDFSFSSKEKDLYFSLYKRRLLKEYPLLKYSFQGEEVSPKAKRTLVSSYFNRGAKRPDGFSSSDSSHRGDNLYEFMVSLFKRSFPQEPTPQQWEKIHFKVKYVMNSIKKSLMEDLRQISKVRDVEELKDWVLHSSVLQRLLGSYPQFQSSRQELAYQNLNPPLGEKVFENVIMSKYVGYGFLALIALHAGPWLTQFVAPSWTPYGQVVRFALRPYLKGFVRSALTFWVAHIAWDSYKFFGPEKTFFNQMEQKSYEAAHADDLLITQEDARGLKDARKLRADSFLLDRSMDALFLVGLPAGILAWRLASPRYFLKKEKTLAQLYEQVGFPKGRHSPSEGFIKEVHEQHSAQLAQMYRAQKGELENQLGRLNRSLKSSHSKSLAKQSRGLREELRLLKQKFNKKQASVDEAKNKLLKVIARVNRKWEYLFNKHHFDLEKLGFKGSRWDWNKLNKAIKDVKAKREDGHISDKDWAEIEIALKDVQMMVSLKASVYLQGGPIHRAILMRAFYGEAAVAQAQKEVTLGLRRKLGDLESDVNERWLYEVHTIKTVSGSEMELFVPRKGIFSLE